MLNNISEKWFQYRPDTILKNPRPFIDTLAELQDESRILSSQDMIVLLKQRGIKRKGFFFFCLAINLYLKDPATYRSDIKRLLKKSIQLRKTDHISRLLLQNIEHDKGTEDLYNADGSPYSEVIFLKEWKLMYENVIRVVDRYLPNFDDTFNFLDIGCASGDLTLKILTSILKKRIYKRVNVDLVEPAQNQLNAATKLLQNEIKQPISIFPFLGSISNYDISTMRYNLINASLSIHHLTRDEKKIAIKQIANHCSYFLLTEFNINHQDYEAGDPRHLASLYYGYNNYLERIYRQADHNKALFLNMIRNFVWNDIKDIMFSSKTKRVEKEILLTDWMEMINLYATKTKVVHLSKNVAIGTNKNYSILIKFPRDSK